MNSIYEVQVSGDCEGRTARVLGYFRTRDMAVIAQQSGIGNMSMGPPGEPKYYITKIPVFGTLEEFAEKKSLSTAQMNKLGLGDGAKQFVLAQQARAKLSDDEYAALLASKP